VRRRARFAENHALLYDCGGAAPGDQRWLGGTGCCLATGSKKDHHCGTRVFARTCSGRRRGGTFRDRPPPTGTLSGASSGTCPPGWCLKTRGTHGDGPAGSDRRAGPWARHDPRPRASAPCAAPGVLLRRAPLRFGGEKRSVTMRVEYRPSGPEFGLDPPEFTEPPVGPAGWIGHGAGATVGAARHGLLAMDIRGATGPPPSVTPDPRGQGRDLRIGQSKCLGSTRPSVFVLFGCGGSKEGSTKMELPMPPRWPLAEAGSRPAPALRTTAIARTGPTHSGVGVLQALDVRAHPGPWSPRPTTSLPEGIGTGTHLGITASPGLRGRPA